MSEVEFVVVGGGDPAAQAAMAHYFAELDERFPTGFDAGDAMLALAEAATLMGPPLGSFVLALRDGDVAGCGGVQSVDEHTAEIKRMWVSPAHRGAGVGGRLLARLEQEVVESGRTRVILDTNGVLLEAIAMYTSRGYTPIERYNDNPYAQHWFAKDVS